MPNEAETQALAAWQAQQIVNHCRAMGWLFVAVVIWTRKDEGGVAGASYFDLPKAEAGLAPRLADAVRMVATEMDRSFEALGARETAGDGYLHTIGGTGVDAIAKRAGARAELDDWLESREFYELMYAYRAAPTLNLATPAFEAVKRAIRERAR
jgi:hypothetical protein